MTTAANIMVGLVALLHAYFLVLEMFLWDKPRGMHVFGTTPEFAAGLVWGLFAGAYFLGAGTCGTVSAKAGRSISFL